MGAGIVKCRGPKDDESYCGGRGVGWQGGVFVPNVLKQTALPQKQEYTF